MSRQEALNVIWRKLIIIFAILLSLSIFISIVAGSFTVPILTFIVGNIGGYIGTHKNLASLKDHEIVQLSGSWLGLILPSFIGGILAGVLYMLFISGIISGELFPKIVPDNMAENVNNVEGFKTIFLQHAEGAADYAKLLFWAFVAGYNQNYVVDILESIKNKSA